MELPDLRVSSYHNRFRGVRSNTMFVQLELKDHVSMTMGILGYLKSYMFDKLLLSIIPLTIRSK